MLSHALSMHYLCFIYALSMLYLYSIYVYAPRPRPAPAPSVISRQSLAFIMASLSPNIPKGVLYL